MCTLRIAFVAIFMVAMAGRAQSGPVLTSAPERVSYEAAVQGDPDAQARLAAAYASGDGFARSDALAFQWFLRAAEQGHAEAQLALSGLFANGKGVPRLNHAAYKWASLALTSAREPQTSEGAARMMTLLARQMSEAEIKSARASAAAWTPRPESRASGAAQPAGPVLAATSSRVVGDNPAQTPAKQVAGRSVQPASKVSLQPESGSRAGQVSRTPPSADRSEQAAARMKAFRSYARARLMQLARRWGR